jgi:pyridoxal phosphate enzyme (YggS family)
MAETGAAARRDELAGRLQVVRAGIAQAARAVGRADTDITLIVVTKTWPTSDIRLLAELGVTDVGENRHPEAEEKAHELADLGLRWHFIGQIQSKKAARIAGYADVIHSVDSIRLAGRLAAGADSHGRDLDCLVQVSLDPAEASAGRGGVAPDQVDELAAMIDDSQRLRLVGVMGVAPLGGDAATAYRTLVQVQRGLVANHPSATLVSGGMSGDFKEAIEAGATHVRVGSAVLGERPLNR